MLSSRVLLRLVRIKHAVPCALSAIEQQSFDIVAVTSATAESRDSSQSVVGGGVVMQTIRDDDVRHAE